MKIIKCDIAYRIFILSLEIKHLVEENNISKRVIIEDFEDIINAQFQTEEKENEDN